MVYLLQWVELEPTLPKPWTMARQLSKGVPRCFNLLRELAATHVRYGYRRLTVLLRREGWQVNAKRVYRLYYEEGLKVRSVERKKIGRRQRVPQGQAEHVRLFVRNDLYSAAERSWGRGKVNSERSFLPRIFKRRSRVFTTEAELPRFRR
jgi:hypothetical protein